MRLESYWIGPVEYETPDVVSFPEGLPGFLEDKEFVIVPADPDEVFVYLQSVNHPEVCLLLTNPFLFFSDYQVEIPPDEINRLGNPDSAQEIATFAVVSVTADFQDSTANLMAPVFINLKKKIGLQFIPQTTEYNTKHPLFSVAAETGEK